MWNAREGDGVGHDHPPPTHQSYPLHISRTPSKEYLVYCPSPPSTPPIFIPIPQKPDPWRAFCQPSRIVSPRRAVIMPRFPVLRSTDRISACCAGTLRGRGQRGGGRRGDGWGGRDRWTKTESVVSPRRGPPQFPDLAYVALHRVTPQPRPRVSVAGPAPHPVPCATPHTRATPQPCSAGLPYPALLGLVIPFDEDSRTAHNPIPWQ